MKGRRYVILHEVYDLAIYMRINCQYLNFHEHLALDNLHSAQSINRALERYVINGNKVSFRVLCDIH